MSQIMLTLGGYSFGLNTAAFQELDRSTEWRWPGQDVFMGSPVLQYVGPGGDSITLPGVIYPEWRGGGGQLDDMRAEADKGQPLTLIDGRGRVMGEWVIEAIDEKQSVFAQAGAPRKQEFTLRLKKFSATAGGSSGAASAQGNTATSAAGAGAANIASPTALLDRTATRAGDSAASLSGAYAYVVAVGESAQAALAPISKAISIALGLKNAALDAKKSMGSTAKALAQAKSLQQMINAATIAVSNSTQAGATAKRALDDVVGSGAPNSAVVAVRAGMVEINKLTVVAAQTQAQATEQYYAVTGE